MNQLSVAPGFLRRLFAIAVVLALICIATPASATLWTLNPGDSIEDNISLASPGDTLILNPGTYDEYNITVLKNIFIRSNSTAGGSSANTIIDAMKSGRIFCDNTSAGYSLDIEGLTLKNGSAAEGGAVCVVNGTVVISSSTISECYASDYGGAIYSENTVEASYCIFTGCSTGIAGFGGAIASPTVSVISCTFTNCGSAVCMGGAIFSGEVTAVSCIFTGCSSLAGGGICSDLVNIISCEFEDCGAYTVLGTGGGVASEEVTAESCTFTNCTSAGDGGGIFSGDTITVSCTFTGCSANGGGGISSINATVTSCTFTGCNGTGGYSNGGGICSDYNTGGTFLISSSFFMECRASAGGAVYTELSGVNVTSSTFTGCRGTDSGGAILSMDNDYLNITSSTFTGCSALNYGGAVLSDTDSNTLMTITSSTFSGCSAETEYGGALYANSSTSEVHYCRIFDCNTGTAVVMENGTLDGENNWWGTNSDPSVYTTALSGGPVDVTPWLVLGARANPSTIHNSMSSTVTADLTNNSEDQDTSAGGHVPDGLPVAFSITSGSGTLSPAAGTFLSGLSTTTYSPAASRIAVVTVTVDDQAVSTTVQVDQAPGGGGGTSGGGSNTGTGVGFIEGLKAGQSATFDMAKGAVYEVIVVAGTDIDKLMITVEKKGSLPSSVVPPGRDVYEFEDVTIYYVNNGDLSGGEFYFEVPKNRLASNGFEFGDIVLLHYDEEAGVWEELKTKFTGEDGTYYFYSAETPSFSWFAIAYSKGAIIVSEGISAPALVSELDKDVMTTATATALDTPAASLFPEEGTSLSSLVIPGLAILLVAIIVVGLITRRRRDKYPDWWDKKQR